jgi:2-oxo-4-hydroxy-4-carboxy-5-ureidoimidazoline decarboxylase
MPQVNGRLSTHVLDTHAGRPAVGVAIELYEFAGEKAHCIQSAITNSDGRTDQPLIGGRPLPIGRYELRFAVGDHFRSRGIASGDPPFLDIVPLRFSIAEPEGHYHVPLLCTPWSYSTYRGS